MLAGLEVVLITVGGRGAAKALLSCLVMHGICAALGTVSTAPTLLSIPALPHTYPPLLILKLSIIFEEERGPKSLCMDDPLQKKQTSCFLLGIGPGQEPRCSGKEKKKKKTVQHAQQ